MKRRSNVSLCLNLFFILFTAVNGERDYMTFNNFTREETSMWLHYFTTRVGVPTIRYRKLWYTECPSIQGVWSPFTFRDPALNLETFPNVSNLL